MIEDLEHLWHNVLQSVQNDLAKPSFDTWLKDSRPVGTEGSTLLICVKDPFARDWVEARYHGLLTKVLHRVSGKEFELRFVVPDDVSDSSRDFPKPMPQQADTPYNNEVSSLALNPKYSFDTFVVGNSNRFAHAAALAVAEAPGRAYNPLFIYGGVGLGKTHLMQAVGHYVKEESGSMKVVYVSSETFTNDLIDAIQRKLMTEFRNKYRNVDVLLIDDIQFVAGKESTQEEFFHTFNHLYEANKQIVISSDRPPKEIPTLEERLRSRFEWGLITDIQPPDYETRIAILRKKAALENFEVPDDVIEFIAEQIHSNIRELEGMLIRVSAYAAVSKQDLTVEMASDLMKDVLAGNQSRNISIETIKKTVAEFYGIKMSDLAAKKRTRTLVLPRQVAMYLCRELTDASLPKVGEEFGGRDHTTVIHSCEKVSNMIKNDPEFGAKVQAIMEKIKHP